MIQSIKKGRGESWVMSRAIRVLFLHINMSVSRSERVLDHTITGFTLPVTACTTLLLLIIYTLKVKKKLWIMDVTCIWWRKKLTDGSNRNGQWRQLKCTAHNRAAGVDLYFLSPSFSSKQIILSVDSWTTGGKRKRKELRETERVEL